MVHLGYDQQGNGIDIPTRHMAVIGQTQLSGKTTTLEALASRCDSQIIAFATKRGESAFGGAHRVQPYFQERADWRFVRSIIESTEHTKIKFETPWLIRACKNAKSLANVHRNVRELMAKSKRSMSQDIYLLLDEYLTLVVPLIARLPKSDTINLEPGLNVMNLVSFPEQLQMLVIGSVVRWVYENANGVIVIVPEAWKFVPQARGNPVKLEVEHLIREGAGLQNFVWFDTQDIAGVDKILLRSASVWLLGVQREIRELKRAMDSIPMSFTKPKPEQIATLKIGQFFACFDETTVLTYVQPAWMSSADAISIATGAVPLSKVNKPIVEPDDSGERKELMETIDDLRGQVAELQKQIRELQATRDELQKPVAATTQTVNMDHPISQNLDLESIFRYVRERLMKEPEVLRILAQSPVIAVEYTEKTLEVDGTTLRGRIALLIMDGFLDEPRNPNQIYNELVRRGAKCAKPGVYNEMRDFFAVHGFVERESATGEMYVAVKSMRKNIRR